MTPQLRTALPLLGALLLGATAGCAGLDKPYPDRRYYLLDVARPGPSLTPHADTTLIVRRVTVSPEYQGSSLVYRTGEMSYESDFYNQFFVSPGGMLTEQVRRWTEASGMVQYVVGATSNIEPNHYLDGRVFALYGDFRRREAPLAVLGMQFFVTTTGDSPAVVFYKDYRREIPMRERTPAALVAAWNEGLRQILTSLEADLRAGPFKPGA